MKIRMNVTYRHHKYDMLYAGREYDLSQHDALPLLAKRLDHLTMWATPVEGATHDDKKEIAKTEDKGSTLRIAKRITKLKIKAKLVETNEKIKKIKENKLSRIYAEIADLEKGVDLPETEDEKEVDEAEVAEEIAK